MCLILAAWHAHPDYRLVVAANRDEFRSRPTAPAHWWADLPDVLAGRDLVANGTWLGLTNHGHFAALTNYRDPARLRPDGPSRGTLVSDCLTGGEPAEVALARVAGVSANYSPFNLFVSDGHDLGIHESVTGAVRLLDPGVYGLSNHLLDTPWPKVAKTRENFARLIQKEPDDDAILALLRDDETAVDEALPDTGVGAEWERLLSSAFIRSPEYGTRSSTLLRMRHDGQVSFREWTWNADGNLASEVNHCYRIQGS